jgi:RNA polymerase sigma factor (sigma-70 family)
MTRRAIGILLEQLRQSAVSDAGLLERFAVHRDEAAFAALVERFGPMVLGVCRRVTGDAHAAEDAFQATFLVLARKAPSLVRQELVGNWLWGVAYRTARRARADAARWRSRRREVHADMAADPTDEVMWRDLRPVLDQEIYRLPAKYRRPFVLCYLEGKTNEQAARKLGCPAGTVFTRLARAREILRSRLTRRAVTLSAVAFTAALRQEAAACVPQALANSTIRAVALFTAGSVGAAGMISPQAATLAGGALRALLEGKLKVAAVLLIAATLAGAGVLCTRRPQDDAVEKAERPPAVVALLPAPSQPEPPVAPRRPERGPGPAEHAGAPPPEGDAPALGSSDEQPAGFGLGFGMGGDSATAAVTAGTRSVSVTVYGSSKLATLSQPAVQKEVALTDKQLQQVRQLQARQQRALQDILPRQPVTARQAAAILRDVERAPQKIAELTTEIDTAIEAFLTGQQRQRLREVTPPQQRNRLTQNRK